MSFVDDEDNYGDEDQNDLMQMIKQNKEDQFMEITSQETVTKVNNLLEEIENHKTALSNAEDALNSAEMELNGVLDEERMKLETEPV